MKLNRKNRDMPEIDVGAFSDIAFLLIVFFILTTTFAKPSGQEIEIPAGSKSNSKKKKKITVVLKEGDILYGKEGKTVSLEDLKRLLAEQKFKEKSTAQRIVILESNKDVLYDHYYKVVMAIRNADGILAILEGEKE